MNLNVKINNFSKKCNLSLRALNTLYLISKSLLLHPLLKCGVLLQVTENSFRGSGRSPAADVESTMISLIKGHNVISTVRICDILLTEFPVSKNNVLVLDVTNVTTAYSLIEIIVISSCFQQRDPVNKYFTASMKLLGIRQSYRLPPLHCVTKYEALKPMLTINILGIGLILP